MSGVLGGGTAAGAGRRTVPSRTRDKARYRWSRGQLLTVLYSPVLNRKVCLIQRRDNSHSRFLVQRSSRGMTSPHVRANL